MYKISKLTVYLQVGSFEYFTLYLYYKNFYVNQHTVFTIVTLTVHLKVYFYKLKCGYIQSQEVMKKYSYKYHTTSSVQAHFTIITA